MKRALISVSDKDGVVEFARELAAMGYEIVSTGGTYKTIKQAGIAATYVTEITGFPEILDGRVKTLHPKVHGGILAKGTPEHLAQLEEQGIVPIDIVAVNLYPFAKVMAKPEFTLEEAVENIDIGGPAMVRAAAKNFERVAIIVNPKFYPQVLEEIKAKGEVSKDLRLKLAAEAYTHTALYDRMISAYFQSLVETGAFAPVVSLAGEKAQDLRYGENPHQKAAFYRQVGQEGTLAYSEQLQGKELSFNNLVDMNAAWALVQEFSEPAAVIVKHTNPCGVAVETTLKDAYVKAFAADPVSAFGGIVACNREVDEASAAEMVKLFLEVIVAPAYSEPALEIFKGKPNLRLLAVGEKSRGKQSFEVKQIEGGFLVQDLDVIEKDPQTWQVVSKAQPSAEDLAELAFAMKVCKHVKSNAIVVTKDRTSLGVGAGQMNRVGSAAIALEQARAKAQGAYLASDAFFPFRDTVDAAAKAGIKAIIQPGGSLKDAESIEAVDEHGLIMVFTGIRHFKH